VSCWRNAPALQLAHPHSGVNSRGSISVLSISFFAVVALCTMSIARFTIHLEDRNQLQDIADAVALAHVAYPDRSMWALVQGFGATLRRMEQLPDGSIRVWVSQGHSTASATAANSSLSEPMGS
jgi:hypothetical protein